MNLLYLSILASNGIKIVPNLRIGKLDDLSLFKSIPTNVMWASGFLGCKKLKSEMDLEFISKIMFVRPSKVLIYGKEDKIANLQLGNACIPYHIYKDYHRLSKENSSDNIKTLFRLHTKKINPHMG